MIHLHTNHGTISIELHAEDAPLGAENFLAYARDGSYDGTVFHRVIPGFMIQGGGYDADMKQRATRDPIRNEAANGLLNEEGTVAWARTSDPHSATAQFFINLKDNDFLDHVTESGQGWGYSVFGRVVEGMDIVRAIAGVKTGRSGMHQDVPVTPVVIERVEVAQ